MSDKVKRKVFVEHKVRVYDIHTYKDKEDASRGGGLYDIIFSGDIHNTEITRTIDGVLTAIGYSSDTLKICGIVKTTTEYIDYE